MQDGEVSLQGVATCFLDLVLKEGSLWREALGLEREGGASAGAQGEELRSHSAALASCSCGPRLGPQGWSAGQIVGW